jgi:predicted O-methyltransferase YrrM
MFSYKIDYKNLKCELCEIGAKYNTDKSSQRINGHGHCHPYTLFYHSLFKNKKDDKLNIAELGIGASLLMWKEYFKNSEIYGFDNNDNALNSFKNDYNTNNIILSSMEVSNPSSINNAFSNTKKMFDFILDDTTHNIDDQVRIIENAHKYLKPGGVLIIEDIFKKTPERDYINRLSHVLPHFQEYYFITFDHERRNSVGWDNDKLLVLIKHGNKIFKNNINLTIITPSCRPNNLIKLRESLNFNYIKEWIIVYDSSKVFQNPNLFTGENNPKIKELFHTSEGKSGNPQRNFGLDNITDDNTYVYFLDDDNYFHPDLYKLLNIMDDHKIYTFNCKNRLNGNNIKVCEIDSAMFLIDFRLCKNIRWLNDNYCADGLYITDCYNQNKDKWIYTDNDLCYYNYLN